MAEHLMRRASVPIRGVAWLARGIVWLAWLMSTSVMAQTLTDPTRAPAGFDPAAGVISSSGGHAGALVLQSVLISPQRRLAVINGETVKLGSHVGNAEVVRIEESEVRLREGHEVRTLKLFEGIEMHATSEKASGGHRSTKQR